MRIRRMILTWFVAIAFLGVIAGCTLSPSIDMGVDFDYYGGKFHVRPNASIGVTGRP